MGWIRAALVWMALMMAHPTWAQTTTGVESAQQAAKDNAQTRGQAYLRNRLSVVRDVKRGYFVYRGERRLDALEFSDLVVDDATFLRVHRAARRHQTLALTTVALSYGLLVGGIVVTALGSERDNRNLQRVGVITIATAALGVGIGVGLALNRGPRRVKSFYSLGRAEELVRRYNGMLRTYYGVSDTVGVNRPRVRVHAGLSASGLGIFGRW